MRATPPKKPEPVSIVAKQPEAAPADPNAAPCRPSVRLPIRMGAGCASGANAAYLPIQMRTGSRRCECHSRYGDRLPLIRTRPPFLPI